MAKVIKDLRQQVYEVCEKLSTNGQKFSVRRVGDELPQQHSISTVHKYVKEWNDHQGAERERIRQSYVGSEAVMEALANETDRLIKQALRDETDEKENYQLLLEQAHEQMKRLEEDLFEQQSKTSNLEMQHQALLNETEVMKQTRQSERKALEAHFKMVQSKRDLKLTVANETIQDLRATIAAHIAVIVELKASVKQMEHQVEMQLKQQDMLIDSNKLDNDEKIDLAKQLAVADARIVELERRIKGS